MIALTLLILTGVYLGLFVLAGAKAETWSQRLMWWALLSMPVVFRYWDYPIVYYQHQRACQEEGGLRVHIQPEKSDRLRLDGDSFYEGSAKSILWKFWPRLTVVEATEDYHSQERTGYFTYTVDPTSTGAAKKDWKFIKSRVSASSTDLYVLTESDENNGKRKYKTVWRLTRNGQLYASWTSLNYVWALGLFAQPVGWRCFSPGDPVDGASGKYPHEELVKLILK